MENKWVLIFSSGESYLIQLVQARLKEEDIDSVEMNKHDSSYTILGEIDLYVRPQDALRAKYLIEKFQSE